MTAAIRRTGALLLTASAFALMPLAARADFQVRSPIVEEGEWEYEQNGDWTHDRHRPDNSGEFSLTNEIGHSVTPWWEPELEIESNRDAGPDQPFRVTAVTLENTFQLLPQGEYWADLGFFAEYSQSTIRGEASDVSFGPLIQKQIGPTLHTLNLLLEREIGPSQDTNKFGFEYAWQSLWRLSAYASPGIEIYGEPGDVGHFDRANDQPTRIGPVVVGGIPLGGTLGNIKYEVGYLQGLTSGTPENTFRWKFEYEVHF